MTRSRWLVVVGLLGACVPPEPVHVDVTRYPTAKAPLAGTADTEALVQATRAILESPRFRDALADLDRLHVSGIGPTISGPDTVAALAGMSPAQHPVPATVTVTAAPPGDPSLDLADTALAGDRASARIALSPAVLARWTSATAADRSCAVEVLAHAYAHTVIAGDKPLFGDRVSTFVKDPGLRVATYAIGAVAGCLYLEPAAGIAGDAFAACIARAAHYDTRCVRAN